MDEKKTILIVEDEAIIAMMMKKTLEKYGFTSIIAHSGEKAISLVKNNTPIDLILMDINLGKNKMDGIETAEIILRDCDIPIIFLSSYADQEIIEKAEKITSYGYVVKDSGEAVLIASIKMAFRLYRAHIEIKKKEQLLWEKSEEYRSLVENMEDVIMRFDRLYRHLYVSPSVMKVVSLSPEDFIGKNHRDLGFDEKLCLFWEGAIERVFNSSKPYETEFMFNDILFNWRLFPEFDSDGMVRSVLTIGRDITAHRKVERDYKNIFNKMINGFALHEIICDPDGVPRDYRFLSVNPAFEAITGLRAEEIIGKRVLEVLPDTEPYWIETYGKVALSGESVQFEQYSSSLGRYFKVAAYQTAPLQFATIFEDITSEKEAEIALNEMNKELIERKKELECIYAVSEIIRKHTALTESLFTEIVSVIPPAFLYPDDTCAGLKIREKEYISDNYRETPWCITCPINVKGNDVGRLSVYYIKETPQHDIGPFLSHEVRLVYTIADRIGKMIERFEAEEMLELSHFAIEHARDAMAIVTPDGRFIDVNSAACLSLGYSRDELLTMSIIDIDLSQSAETIKNIWDQLKIKGELGFETIQKRKDGTLVPVEVVLTSLVFKDSEYFFAVVRDITERKQAEERLKDANAQLAVILDSLEALVYVSDFNSYEVLFINEYGRRIFGDKVGHKCWEVFQKEQEGPCPFCTNKRLLSESGTPLGTYRWEHENTMNGRWYECLDRVIKWSDGHLVRIQIAMDITERKKMENALLESEAKYRTLIEKANEGVAILQDSNFVFVNEKLCELLGVPMDFLIGNPFIDYVWPEDRELVWVNYNKRIAGEAVADSYEFRIIGKDGWPAWIYLSATVIKWNKKAATLNLIMDITKLKRLEAEHLKTIHELTLKKRELESLLESSRIVLEGGDFVSTSRRIFEAAKEITGAQSGYVALLTPDGQNNKVLFLDSGGLPCTVDPDLPMPVRGLREVAYRRGEAVYENNFMDSPWVEFIPKGHVVLKNVMFAPLRVEGKTFGIIGLANKKGDFTEDDRRIANALGQMIAMAFKNSQQIAALKEINERLQYTLEEVQLGAWEIDLINHTITISPQFKHIFGYDEPSLEWTYEMFLEHVLSDDRTMVDKSIRDVIETDSNLNLECRIQRADGEIRWVWVAGHRMACNNGNTYKIAGIIQDITDRKETENKIRSLLTEKEVLLREVHHRIKNNLATISSLLSLQADLQNNVVVSQLLKDACIRIKSMGVLYDRLYRSENIKEVPIKDYITTLAEEIIRLFPTPSQVKIDIKTDSFTLQPETLTPLGIIINELITNSLKHAFPDRKEGFINISAKKHDNHITIIVEDDGVGIPENIDIENASTLGLQVVHMLTEQIGGTLKIERTKGTKIIIEFDQDQ